MRPRDGLPLLAVWAGAGAVLLWNLRRALECREATVCVDRYWADFWLTAYADGYRRRGLLGQIVRVLSDGTMAWFTLNILAAIVAGATLVLVYVRYFRGLSPEPNWRLAAFLLLAGPPTMVVVETLGDPLHAALLVVCGALVVTEGLPPRSALAITALAGVGAALIHEASIALLWPVVLAAALWRSGRVMTLSKSLALVLLACGALALLDGAQPSTGVSLNGLILPDGAEYHAASSVLPPMTALFREQWDWAASAPFSDVAVDILPRIAGVVSYPAVMLLLLGSLGDRAVVRIYVILLLSSLPLYVVATDWGRFSAYSLLAALVLARVPAATGGCVFPRRIEAAWDWVEARAVAWVPPAGALIVLPLAGYPPHNYRDGGLTPWGVAFLVGAVLLTRAVAPGTNVTERPRP